MNAHQDRTTMSSIELKQAAWDQVSLRHCNGLTRSRIITFHPSKSTLTHRLAGPCLTNDHAGSTVNTIRLDAGTSDLQECVAGLIRCTVQVHGSKCSINVRLREGLAIVLIIGTGIRDCVVLDPGRCQHVLRKRTARLTQKRIGCDQWS